MNLRSLGSHSWEVSVDSPNAHPSPKAFQGCFLWYGNMESTGFQSGGQLSPVSSKCCTIISLIFKAIETRRVRLGINANAIKVRLLYLRCRNATTARLMQGAESRSHDAGGLFKSTICLNGDRKGVWQTGNVNERIVERVVVKIIII